MLAAMKQRAKREARGDIDCAGGIDRRAHHAGEDYGIVQDLGFDVRTGQQPAEERIHHAGVLFDSDFEDQNLLAVLVEEEDIGLTDLLADQMHPVRSLHDGVHDFGRRNHDVPQVARNLDHHGLVAAELYGARLGQAVTFLDAQYRMMLGRGELHAVIVGKRGLWCAGENCRSSQAESRCEGEPPRLLDVA